MATETSASLPQPVSNQRKRNALLLWFAVAFAEGIADFFVHNLTGEELYKLFSLFVLVLNTIFMVYWFVLDARERKFKLNQKWIFGLVIIAFVTAPVYFAKTRGKQFWKPWLLAIGCLFLVGLCFGLGNVLAEISGIIKASPL